MIRFWTKFIHKPQDHQFKALALILILNNKSECDCTIEEVEQATAQIRHDYNEALMQQFQPLIEAITEFENSENRKFFKALQRRYGADETAENIAKALYLEISKCGTEGNAKNDNANIELFRFLISTEQNADIVGDDQKNMLLKFIDAITLAAISSGIAIEKLKDSKADTPQRLTVETEKAWVARAAIDSALSLAKLTHCHSVKGELRVDYRYTRELSPCKSLNPDVRVRHIAETLVLATAMGELRSSDVESREYEEDLERLDSVIAIHNDSQDHRFVYEEQESGESLVDSLHKARLKNLRVISIGKEIKGSDARMTCSTTHLESYITETRKRNKIAN